jgi:hypothetical protein
MHWSGALMIAAVLSFSVGCSPAIDRPIRGAVPGSPAAAPPGLPPTLEPAAALRLTASPSPAAANSTPSPGLTGNSAAGASPSATLSGTPSAAASPSVVAAPPIVRTLAPGANGTVAAGDAVTVSAVLVGRAADLASASLSVDGADTGAQIDKTSSRQWSIHATRPLAAGPHTARVLVRDALGTNGGFTWQFTVGGAQPAASPKPTPTS